MNAATIINKYNRTYSTPQNCDSRRDILATPNVSFSGKMTVSAAAPFVHRYSIPVSLGNYSLQPRL